MLKKAFSLIEIMVSVIIIGVLATISIPAYKNVVEESKTRVCDTNLKALKSALDVYVVEHNVVPGDLGMLPKESVEKAFACQLKGKEGWKIRLALLVRDMDNTGMAYADFIQDLAQGNLKIVACPKNTKEGISYGVNSILVGINAEKYRKLSRSEFVIADCDKATFESVEADGAHRHYKIGFFTSVNYANAIDKAGDVERDEKTTTEPAPAPEPVPVPNPAPVQETKKECKKQCQEQNRKCNNSCNKVYWLEQLLCGWTCFAKNLQCESSCPQSSGNKNYKGNN
jgi:prepilin-type N-terminal cleavage/methylation domain-containing protein